MLGSDIDDIVLNNIKSLLINVIISAGYTVLKQTDHMYIASHHGSSIVLKTGYMHGDEYVLSVSVGIEDAYLIKASSPTVHNGTAYAHAKRMIDKQCSTPIDGIDTLA